ncbi:GNAT family N-acetyltransferase [Streptomyces sp. NPDC088725]|uniref:GNAT family N-acetyltransferase n=1 Tax=Streptomyces sp. NPDC088725 TaxID=3365873 RepID=UPI003827AAC5
MRPDHHTRLRKARAADLPMIYRGELRYMRDIEPENESGWTAALDRNLALWVDNLDRTVVLEAGTGGDGGSDGDGDGESAGYAMWTATETGRSTLVTIAVTPRLRGRGLGARLLGAFAEAAAASGATTLELGVHRRNPARRLYEREGYAYSHEEGDYFFYTRAAG